MSFSNPILGSGGTLVRDLIKSDNFVTGVSGWEVTRDGEAEFNNIVARGTVEIGPDNGFQIAIVSLANTGQIQVWTHAASEGAPANIRGQIGNVGAANEWMQMALSSARHPSPGIADDTITIALNSQNADNTSRPNINIFWSSAPGVVGGTIATLDQNLFHLFTDMQIDGNLNGWAGFTPQWINDGTATYSTNGGYYKNFGDIVYVNIFAIVNNVGSGTSAVGVTIPGITIDRTSWQALTCHFQRTGAEFETGNGLCLTSGSAGTIDRIRIQDGGAADVVKNLQGSFMASGAQIVIQGWLRATVP